ncbi:MAG: dUTP diphosphatase, partial [Phototrophicales bacterium]
MKCLVKRLSDTAILPKYQREGDAALDIYADQSAVILPGKHAIISTGVAFALPPGHVGLIWDRGGMAANHVLHTMAGVVDENYRGELMIVMINLSDRAYQIEQGDRIAQMIIQPVVHVELEEADQLDETNRGEARFM